MATDIELEDLREKREKETAAAAAAAPSDPEEQSPSHDARDGSVTAWAYASAAIIASTAAVLLLFPRFLLFLSVSAEFAERALTPLERFLALHFSFFLFAIAITLIVYIPSEDMFEVHRQRDALGHPLLAPLSAACLLSSFVAYNAKNVGALSFAVSVLTGIIGLWGVWVALFEGTSSISKKTGADKHTSAFLFGNKTAASKQKKEWKKAQKQS